MVGVTGSRRSWEAPPYGMPHLPPSPPLPCFTISWNAPRPLYLHQHLHLCWISREARWDTALPIWNAIVPSFNHKHFSHDIDLTQESPRRSIKEIPSNSNTKLDSGTKGKVAANPSISNLEENVREGQWSLGISIFLTSCDILVLTVKAAKAVNAGYIWPTPQGG